jgi:vanillate/3-O-methylgallate O-demethylase
MTTESLQDRIDAADGVLPMLRGGAGGGYPFPIPPEFSNWRDEQAAWKSTAVLFDQSHHMTDIYFQGPDVRRLLSDVGVNSFATFGRNKAKQFVACTAEGHLIGDAILFGHEDDLVSLVGIPIVPRWVAYQAETGGYDVKVTRDEWSVTNTGGRKIFRYQVQGPEALRIVEQASSGTMPAIKFFNIGEFTIAGVSVRALNHTMTGIPGQELTGLELWGPAEHGEEVLSALLEAGTDFGLRQGGAISYSTTAPESGWLGLLLPGLYSDESARPYREYLAATSFEGTASLGGSFDSADVNDYLSTPWDLGYGRVVKFDHDFIGSEALKASAAQPHRVKVWLRWNDDDVAAILSRSLFGTEPRPKYLKVPNSSYSTFEWDSVLAGDRLAGVSGRCNYTVNVGGYHSIALLDAASAVDGTEVTMLWGEPEGAPPKPSIGRHVTTPVRATVSTRPLA